MADEISNAPAPASAPSAGSPAPSSDGPGSAPASSGSHAGSDGGSSDGKGSRDSNGRFQAQATQDGSQAPVAAPAPVVLRSLKDLADADPGTYSQEERKKVRISARNGIQDDAELDARTLGKPFVKDGSQRPEKPADGTPPNQDPTKDSAGQPLHKLVKAISPYLDPADPDKAVENVKTLHSNLHKANERANQLESYYSEVETGIEQRLKKGLSGVREIFQAFNLNPDEFLVQAPAAQAPARTNGAAAIPGELSLADLHDDDFLTGAQTKGLVASLAKQIRDSLKADFEKEYGPLKESHSKITEAVKADAEFRATQERRAASIKDAQLHSDYYGKFYPEFKLSESASKVWDESVAEERVNGKVQLKLKAQQHPEWPKLQEILKFRQKEYLEAGNDAATYQDYLYRRVNESGNFFELVRNAEQKGKQSVLEAQNKRLQPALAPRGNAGPLDSFRVPKSEEDVSNMTPEQRKELRKRVMAGKIQVR